MKEGLAVAIVGAKGVSVAWVDGVVVEMVRAEVVKVAFVVVDMVRNGEVGIDAW